MSESSSAASSSTAPPPTGAALSRDEILAGLNERLGKERSAMSRITELEGELREYECARWIFAHCFYFLISLLLFYTSRVIETLRNVPAERRAFRMVGEVLVEKTAGTVLPELESTREQVFSKISILSLHLLVHVNDPYSPPFPIDWPDATAGEAARDRGGGGTPGGRGV